MRSDGVNEPNEKVTNEVLFERQEHFSRNYGYDITSHFNLPQPDSSLVFHSHHTGAQRGNTVQH